MKILHIVPSLDPATGGPPLVVSRLAAAQAALGHRVEVLSYEFPNARDRIEKSLEAIPGHAAVVHHRLAPLTRFEHLFARGATAGAGPLVADADFVHLHGVWDPIIKAVAVVAREQRIPYTVTPHGMLDPWALGQSKLKKQIAMRLGYRKMLSQAAFLHMLNIDEQQLIKPLALPTRTEVIPNGLFTQEIDPLPPPGTFQAAHPQLQGKPYILFLSRLHYKKGLDYLADAFAITAGQLPEIQLVVAGPDDGAQADFTHRISIANLQDRTHLVGPLYGSEKLAAFVDCAVFCLPSRQEGFSIAILEAMACARPVVISTSCHFPEVAQHRTGEVVPLEPTAIATALTQILSDPALAKQMGAAGRDLVYKNYTWPAVARQTITAYETVVNSISLLRASASPR